jgi:hypothetical protein
MPPARSFPLGNRILHCPGGKDQRVEVRVAHSSNLVISDKSWQQLQLQNEIDLNATIHPPFLRESQSTPYPSRKETDRALVLRGRTGPRTEGIHLNLALCHAGVCF